MAKLNGKQEGRELRAVELPEDASGRGFYILEAERIHNDSGARKYKWVEDRVQFNEDEARKLYTFLREFLHVSE